MSYNIPENFDWIAYRSLNIDLRFITNERDAIKHYKMHGHRQNRPYTFKPIEEKKTEPVVLDHKGLINNKLVTVYQNKANNLPEDFDWLAYRSLNRDLKSLKSYGDAVKHYQNHGRHQSRPYKHENKEDVVTPINYMEKDLRADQLLEISEVNYEQMNKINGLPCDFDWHVYKSSNPDLHVKTYQDAAQHYLEHGFRESRKYTNKPQPSVEQSLSSLTNVVTTTTVTIIRGAPPPQLSHPVDENEINYERETPKDFDWIAYKTSHPDLQHIKSRQDAMKHYVDHGRREGRLYKPDTTNLSTDIIQMEKSTSDYDWITYRPVNPSRDRSDTELISEVDLPYDFDWKAYKLQNPDLIGINSQSDAIRHYRDHGYRENRLYVTQTSNTVPQESICPNGIPSDFNWIYYRSKYPDLKYLISNEQEAIRHYVEHGYRENRKYAPSEEDQLVDPVPRPDPPKNKPKRQPMLTQIIQPNPDNLQPKARPTPKQRQPNRPKPCHRIPNQTTEQDKPKLQLKRVEIGKKSYQLGELKIVSTPPPSGGQVPNIIHFIYGFKEPTPRDLKEFDLVKYVAIYSAYCLNKPDKIYFHYKYEPFGKLWDQIKPYLTLHQIEPPTTIFDRKVTRYAHKADIVRLDLMNEQGGIYLDIDTICLRPLTALMKYDYVMGIQGDNYGLCNAVMMSKPNTEFGRQWYKSYESFTQQWDLHSVKVPYNLAQSYPITILPNDAFFYPLWDPFPDLVLSNQINYDCCHKVFQNSYCLHLWETWCGRYLQNINEQSLFQSQSFYNLLARKFIQNSLTLIMIVSGDKEQVVSTIGSYYKIVARDDVSEMIIYDNYSHDSELISYLDNLPNINPKFKVIHAAQLEETPYIKRSLCEAVNTGVIIWFDQPMVINEEIIDQAVDALYDESIGMVGLIGGNFMTNHKYEEVSQKEKNVIVDSVIGCQFFRSELQFYGIHLDTSQLLYDLDFCCQIKNLGKNIVLLSITESVPIASVKLPQVTKEVWGQFFQKWSK